MRTYECSKCGYSSDSKYDINKHIQKGWINGVSGDKCCCAKIINNDLITLKEKSTWFNMFTKKKEFTDSQLINEKLDQILEMNKEILKQQEEMLEKQDQLLEKQKEMLKNQDQLFDKTQKEINEMFTDLIKMLKIRR